MGNSAPRNHLLNVQIRSSTARRRRQETMTKWVWNFCLVAVLVTGSWVGVRAALDKLFFQNAEYTLSRITMNLDNLLTREEALAATGLQEGVNIFSLDLPHIEAVLKAMPQVQNVQIERELPDHLSISLTARQPIAWVAADGEKGDATASESSLLVDTSGFLMRPRHILPEYYHLPVIYGAKSDNIRDGEPLSGEDLRVALELLDTVAKHPESLLRIRTLDISKGYCIEVINDGNARILFSASNFEEQLARLQTLLAHCADSGRTLDSVNLMVKRNTPVTFVVAIAPPVEPKVGPATPAPKSRRN